LGLAPPDLARHQEAQTERSTAALHLQALGKTIQEKERISKP
jgi:hypothetical protein